MTATMYGQMQSELRAQENLACRQIVKEIGNVGITQRQSLVLIYLLASELEDGERMRAITGLVRELGGDELFLIGREEGEGPDGKTDA